MELNPHHPTTKAVHGQWHKLFVALMLKMGKEKVTLTAEDFSRLNRPGGMNIMVYGLQNGMEISIVGDEEANRLAKNEGGVSNS